MTTKFEHKEFTRRDFLRVTGAVAAGLLISSCQAEQSAPLETPTLVPSASKQPMTLETPTLVPSTSKYPVTIGQVQTYDRTDIDKQMQMMIDQLGGLSDVVKPGDSVAIKTNLTGGVYSGRLGGLAPEESFVTHPEVVRALVKQVKAAGAKEIFIVEAVYEWESYRDWGYEDVASDLSVNLIDLNDSKPYSDFVETAVGLGGLIYKAFIFNKLLNDVDVFMSVSKMKNHYHAGVTHTMKNLYGLVPYRFYRLGQQDKYRSGFHGTEAQIKDRLPSIIVDLNRARPINFSLIDGIKTSQGGEGPWINSLAPIEPGVLIAGKNSVATDAVATAVMGHNPQGEYPESPFVRCVNHLNLAAQAGLGSNNLDDIEVLGKQISAVQTNFVPAP